MVREVGLSWASVLSKPVPLVPRFVSTRWGLYSSRSSAFMPLFSEIFVCFDMTFLSEIFANRGKRGHLVSWVEKASLERIRLLLEITEMEHSHKLLLYVRNLQELGASPFPYIVPIFPRLLSKELVRVNTLLSLTC